MNKVLKKCPFCGNGAKLVKKWNGVLYQAQCESCGAKSPELDYYNVIKCWNSRKNANLPESDLDKMFGERVERIRKTAGISIRDMAQMCNTSYLFLQAVESGQAIPEPQLIVKIAQVFGTSTDYLLTGRSRLKGGESK